MKPMRDLVSSRAVKTPLAVHHEDISDTADGVCTWGQDNAPATRLHGRKCLPRRRGNRGHAPLPLTLTQLLLSALLLLSAVCPPVTAVGPWGSIQRLGRGRSLRHGGILIDRRPSPVVDLNRRQNGDLFGSAALNGPAASSSTPASSAAGRPTFSSTASAAPSTETGSPSSVVAPSTAATPSSDSTTAIISAPTAGASLPQPFDGGLGNNFTQPSCPTFINAFLRNETFTSCLPFSLLLQNSVSFFQASKSLSRMIQTLDATCKVVYPTCSSLMGSLAQQLRQDSNCGADYNLQNPTVRQAYNGLLAYDPLYKAGCLRDDNSTYCFASAVTNSSSPSDSYIYYLPLGVNLPGGSQPTCSGCLKKTMAFFEEVAGNKSQPIAGDYASAAQLIDLGCGPNFVNTSIPQGMGANGKSAAGTVPVATMSAALAMVLAVWVHQLI